MRPARRTDALRLALALAALCAAPAARAQFPITESFMNSTAPGWSIIGNAALTGNNVIDATGAGWLRLTDATTNQAGSAIYNTNFLSTSGITITFDYADYGGTGADGFSFYLIDGATAAPTVGSSGGPLGYAAKYTNTFPCNGAETVGNPGPGVTNGYVGIGFDEFGNYSNCQSGTASPTGTAPQSVVIRGSGTYAAVGASQTAFRYLIGTTVASVSAGARIDNVLRATPRHARVSIVNQKITVALDFGAGLGYQTVINAYDLSTATGQVALPATFKMGFSGSTGGSTNYHEIRNVKVDLPANLAITQAVAPTTVSVNGTVTFTITISNDPTNAANGSIINDAFPAGLSNVSWTAATTNTAFGAPVLPRTSGTGNLAETIATFPKGSTITYTVTATVTAAAAGQVLANTVNLVPPSGLSNLLSNTVAANLTVNKMGSTTTFTSGTNPTVFGQPTTLTATVTGVAAGPPPPAPTGTVNFLDGGATVVGSCTLAAGTCSAAVSSLAVGTHTLTASYLGVTDFSASTSSSLSQVVNKAATTTVLASSANPSRSGETATLTATVAAVAPGAGTPSGLVTILDGGVSIGTCTLAAGTCTLAVSSFTIGTHPLTATYPGDGSFLASATASSLSQVVNQSLTTTGLTSSVNPTRFGQSTTLTATVTATAPGVGTPTGTVTFLDGAASIGSCALAAGTCTFAISTLTVATHTLTATYGGDTSFVTSTSGSVSQVVNQSLTTTALTSSVNPTVFGQSTTLTATVSVTAPGVGPATGTITFLDGASSIGSCVLSSGSCTLAVTSLTVGSHSLTASLAASSGFGASTSAIVTQTVNKAATGTVVTSSSNPSVFGQSVTLTATVTATAPGAGTPGGTVTFSDGVTTLGPCTLVAGACTVSSASLSVGAHAFTASSSGNASFLASTSAVFSQTVNKAATGTAIVSSVNPTVFGQSTTLTATVTATAPGAGTPGGTVTFSDGVTTLGPCTLAAGSCSVAVSSLTVGAHPFTASSSGDANFLASTSAALTQTVNKANTSTAIVSSVDPTVFGQATTLTATVTATAPGAGTPGGTVTFSDGVTTLGPCALAAGSCSVAVSSLTVGAHAFTASYAGNASFNTSTSGALSQVVNQAVSATAIAVAPNPSIFGEAVTLTATVTAVAPGAGVPSGSVTFSDGVTTYGPCTLAAGTCSVGVASFSVGTHPLAASYGGDGRFVGSGSATSSLTVVPASTTTGVASSLPTSTFGDPVTFTATVAVVAPGAGLPTGQVRFFSDGAALGDVALDGSGHAGFTTGATTLPVGPHAITAQYLGDGSFTTSTSAPLIQSVSHATVSLGLVSSATPSVTGQPVTFTTTVTVASGLPEATGTVTFKDGAATLGTCPLAAGSCTLTSSNFTVGAHPITAIWGGDANYNTVTSAPLTQQVDPAATATALVAAPAASVYGEPVALTATITITAPGAGVPAGNVTFAEGNVVLGSASVTASGTATLNVATLAIGSHDVVATYGGDPGFALSISPLATATVDVASATVTATAAPSPSVFGEPVTFSMTVAPVAPSTATPAGTVTLREGATILGTFPLTSGAASFTSSQLAAGDHALTVDFNGDGTFATASGSAAQHVDPGPTSTDLAVAPSPATFGEAVTLTASVAVLSPAAGSPTGLVTFLDGLTVIGSAAIDGAGVATLPVSSFAVGPHDLTASFGGDASFSASGSATASLTVIPATTSTDVLSSLPASSFGDPVTFTAAVAVALPGAGLPGGQVRFFSDGVPLGDAALDGTGHASLTAGGTTLPVGPHAITAQYLGDGSFSTSTSAPLTQSVSLAAVALLVASDAHPSVTGEPVTFTATAATAGGLPSATGTVTVKDGATTLGTCTLSGGACSFASSALAVGVHAITATWGGDANYNAVTSAPLTQQVDPAATSTALAPAPAASVYGEPVTLTATITITAPGAGIPTGNVTFAEGNVVLGNAPLDVTGHAALGLSSLAVGSHDVVATYGGDPGFALSISPLATATVDMASATVTATAAPSPSVFGEPVVFSITVAPVAPSTGTPAGTVTLRDGATILGTCVLATGTCTITTDLLSAGDHALVVDFTGDGTFTAAPGSVAQHVDLGATSTDVAVAPNPATYGDAVTFTASVAVLFPAAGDPSGLVAFSVDGVTVGTATVAAGVATFTSAAAAIAGGPHDVVATYLGDASFATSASAIATLVVTPAPVTLLLAASPAAAVFGQPVTLTVAASSSAGVPTGAVTFSVDGLPVGTITLSATGQATLPISALPVGDHALSVAFAASADWQAASDARLLPVTRATTALALSAAPASPVFGQAVTLTALVTVTAPGSGTPSGLVTFLDGSTVVGTCTIAAGTCALTVADLAVGAHSLTASWAGDADLLGCGGATSTTVARAATTTTVAAVPGSAAYGDPVRFTASVTAVAPGAGTPTGTVTFTEGGVTLGTGTLDGGGQAVLDLSTLAAGTHAVGASYASDGSFAASATSTPVQVVIARAPVLVTVVASPSPTTAGELVTFTATVTSTSGLPTGTVTFRDGPTLLGTASIDASGQAVVTSAGLAPGSYTITAVSGGDANFAGGTGTTTLVVGASTTVATVTTSRNPSRHGRPVTFTATLTSPNGLPTGTVTFKDAFGGTPVILGTATLSGGVAQLTTRSLVKGVHPITVEYAGVAPVAATVGALAGDETVENSPPVAGSGTALALGTAAATGASIDVDGALDGGDLTLEAWIHPTWTSPAQVAATPVALRLGAGAATQVALGVSADRTAVTATVGSTQVSATAAVGDGGWHHVALVAQGSSVTLQVDGALAASFTGTRAASGNTLLVGEGFVGEVDEVRAWTTARTAAQLGAVSHQPLLGSEAGLAGLWRMDEGAGLELFDAGPLHLDGAVQLASGASSGFTASTAWRDWRVISGEPLDPVHAGYDLDGDPLTLTIFTPAGHGLASVDGAALAVGYTSTVDYLGADGFTYRLDDGAAQSDYRLDLQVTPVLVCQVSADCTGQDSCVQGVCRPANSIGLRAGGCGCSSAGSEAVVPWALLVFLWGAWRRRRAVGGAR